MTEQPSQDPAGDFIRAHRDRFTLEEISERLRQAGHSPEAIQAAIARVQAMDRGASPTQAGSGARLVAKLLVTAVFGLSGWFLTSVVASYGSSGLAPSSVSPLLIGAGNIVILVLIALGLFWIIDRRREGQLVWVVLLASLVLAPLLTLGLCSASLMLGYGA